MINAIPKSKKNKRCQLHSLDTHKPKPLGYVSSKLNSVLFICKLTFGFIFASSEWKIKCAWFQGKLDGCVGADVTGVQGRSGRHWQCRSPRDPRDILAKTQVIVSVIIASFNVYVFSHIKEINKYTVYIYPCRFCTDCKNKVLRAYNILVGELDSSKEKGYCAALYEGLCCCPHERHIHVYCETDFIAHLLDRAEPEFCGAYE